MLKIFVQKNTKIKKTGFTLVEALVAISILMIAIASPMLLAQKSLSSATLSKDQMIASFLAQDAIETIRNIRDQIAVNPNGGSSDWLALLKDCYCTTTDKCDLNDLSKSEYCVLDTTTGTVYSKDPVKNPLKISYTNDGENNFTKYDYVGAENSKFSRYINIQMNPYGNKDEAIVNVKVSWEAPAGTQSIDIQDFLYNYSENY